jgi:uncharacterized membrane protein YhaH (DUF805 family)
MNLSTFTSFDGRIPRKTFWLGYLVMLIVSWILMLLVSVVFGVSMFASPDPTLSEEAQMMQAMEQMNAMMLPLGIVLLLTLWPSLAIYTKRWHDRNKSGWWTLIIFVPLIGAIWMLIELGFLRGTEGANRFGPDPIAD